MKNPVRPEPFGYAQESLDEGRAGFFIHPKGEYVVGRPCFDIAQHERPTTYANCSF